MEQRVYERVRKQVILCQDGSPFVPQYPGGINFLNVQVVRSVLKFALKDVLSSTE